MKLVFPSALPATGRRPEDRSGMGAHDILTGFRACHRILECSHLRDRVGIRTRFVRQRGILALHTFGVVEERGGADSDGPAHAERLGGIENVLRATNVHGLEIGEVLTCSS